MKRRDFVTTSLAATASTALLGLAQTQQANAAENNAAGAQQYYELRTYTLKPDADNKVLDNYLGNAAIPAWNRLGINPVGVFTELDKPQATQLFVLLPYNSLEAFITAPTRLAADADYQKAAADYLNIPATSPAYARMESSLMLAFAGMQKLVLPEYSVAKKPRIFELRVYESHSEQAGLKKIEMFNKGEIDIMRRAGMAPIFYGQMIIGPNMPNLTYMLSAEDRESHKTHWNAFIVDPEWKKLSAIPEYANAKIITKISNKFLTPTTYSQI